MAANFSGCHVNQEPAGSDDQNSAVKVRAVYKPLHATHDSIRVLTIHPASPSDGRISCEISEHTFEERITYEALSYQWGDKTAIECIIFNGVEWTVTQNLLDALYYLRTNRPTEAQFWVDALCINQADMNECSAQVKLMRHIYFRASTVIVWLGKKYKKAVTELPQLQALGQGQISETANLAEPAMPNNTTIDAEAANPSENDEALDYSLAKELYRNGYWKRVWIVQEVCLAQKPIVCFGNYAFNWDRFIHLLIMHKVGNKGPLTLHEQRGKWSKGDCRLLQLLKDYQHAQCHDPKDKVYGMIGLANDARRFPVDYNKSRFEIWKDVMEFASRHNMLKDHEVIPTGNLIKNLLMGTRCEPLDQILRNHAHMEDALVLIGGLDSFRGFRVPAKVLGCVQYIGFRPREIVNHPNKQELWEDMVQAYAGDDAAAAHTESDMLLRKIVMPDGSDLTGICFTYDSVVQWSAGSNPSGNGLHADHGHTVTDWQARTTESLYGSESEMLDKSLIDNVRLYQLDNFFCNKDWKMGVVFGGVRLGDLICWVASSRMAIVLRPQFSTNDDRWTFQAVGTAVMAKDLQGISIEAHENRYMSFCISDESTGLRKPQNAFFKPSPWSDSSNPSSPKKNDPNLTINLDAIFVFILLEEGRIFKELEL